MAEEVSIRSLIDRTQLYLPSDTLALIEDAYEFAAQACQANDPEGRLIQHLLKTAITAAELQLDEHCIAAALLHHVPETWGGTSEGIEARFGPEAAKLVDGLLRLARVTTPEDRKPKRSTVDVEAQAESMRKMLMAMAEDLRVVFIKLADQLQHMRAIGSEPPSRQRVIAENTRQIYAPIAHRLGILQIQSELDDLAFRYLEPERYREVVRIVAAGRRERENFMAQVTKTIKEELTKADIQAEVTGRLKHLYSIWRKTEKYAAQGRQLSEIYDLLGFRIVVGDINDCYQALGVIHSLWHPVPGEFRDYIANPREGVYRALHTTVLYTGKMPLEVQIRTHEMHRIAEYGIAAHWRYKEGAREDKGFEEKMAIVRQLLDWYKDVGGAEFLESISTDVFEDRVLVFTPKGDIKDLPAGSTPLDFAYRIHTDLGNRCVGAKANGKMVPLNYELQSGDTVEILATKSEKGPSRDWLTPAMGYLKTSHAREKARQWFRRQERAENIERGRELLDKELKRIGISVSEEELASLFKRDTVEDFLAAIGSGDISTSQVATKLAVRQEKEPALSEAGTRETKGPTGIQVMGVGDLLTYLAPCCNPVPGDEIIGYVTRAKGVSVHRKDCANVLNIADKERLVKVEWGPTDRLWSVPLVVDAYDRVGLLRDLSTVIADEKVNIATVSMLNHSDRTTSVYLTLETKGIEQLSRLMSKLEGVKGVLSVARHGQEVKLAN
ncbi:MAG: RelA/SpoT family protein [Chloroflexota bacterium]